MDSPIRVMLAQIGQPVHLRAVHAVARALRDAGMDVIFAGPHLAPDPVVTAAIQEDVDVLGVSLTNGMAAPEIAGRLHTQGAGDIIVNHLMLQETQPQEIVETLRRLVSERGPR